MEIITPVRPRAASAAPEAARVLQRQAAELITSGSIECTLHDAARIERIADLLPLHTSVYVTALPHQSLDDTLAGIGQIRRAGLDPVPHLAARRIPSRRALERFLERAVLEHGVRRVLVIGGDDPRPAGPYADSVALLEDDLLARAGIREVGIAGYPEGHARIGADRLLTAFNQKRSLLRRHGLGLFVLTQFSFAPARVIEFCSHLARTARDVPVYVGMAGPTEPGALLRFAQRCGVSASLRALQAMGFGAAALVSYTDPHDQLRAVARYCAPREDCNVVGVHFFSFGNLAKTARWMNQVVGVH